jgi:hypothetical protein
MTDAAANENDDASLDEPVHEPVVPDQYARRYARITAPGVLEGLREKLAAAIPKGASERAVAAHARRVADRVAAAWDQAMRTRAFPAEGEPLVPWLITQADVARRRESRHRAKLSVMAGRDAAMEAVADEAAPESSPVLDKVRVAAEAVAAERPVDARAFEMLRDHIVREKPVASIAADNDINPKDYYNQTERFTARVRRRLASPTVLGLLLLGFVVGYLLNHPPRPADRARLPPVGVAPHVPEGPDSRAIAADIKEEAFQACAAQSWATCYAKLNDAVKVDPTLANDPAVTAAIEKARKGVVDDLTKKAPPPNDSKKAPGGARP